MFFTLIIPAYNCRDTIDRLMTSIINQHFDNLKVIVIDDSDSENLLCNTNFLQTYQKSLHLEYHIRNKAYEHHCPGNTRHDGLNYALQEDTEYIFFVDCDDELEPDTLSIVADKLKELNKSREIPIQVMLTPFYRWEEKSMTVMSLEKKNIGWLHGKFYNKDFLIRNGIQFKPELVTHEDVFFNTLVNCSLIKENTDFLVFEQIIYKWYHRDNSESHKEATETGQNFLEKNFEDYILAITLPTLQIANSDPYHFQAYGNNLINGIVTSYFYFQGFLYSGNPDLLARNYNLCKWQVKQAILAFRYSKETIIALIKEQAEIYNIDREECIKGVGFFIEQESIIDYLYNMNLYT